MMKWLRAHTKEIMVALVLLAMFSFVGGPSLVNILAANPAADVVMKIFDREVTQGELSAAQNEAEALRHLLVNWKYDRGQEMTIRHWLMLAEEAQRAGIVVAQQDVLDFIEQRDEFRRQQNLPSLEDLRRQRRVSTGLLRRAAARDRVIQENAARVLRAALPSEPQIKHYARMTQDKVKVKLAILDANRFVDSTEVIPEEELIAHFERYKDVLPGEGEAGFGYRFPRRVTLQYVTASVTETERRVRVSLDEIKAYWKGRDREGLRNRDRYTKTVEVEPPAPASAPASTQPAEPPAKVSREVPKTFTEAKAEIEQELRRKKALKVVRAAMNELARDLAAPWNALRTDKQSGYKPIPDEVRAPDYLLAAMQRVQKKYGIVLNYSMSLPLSKEDLAANPLLGRARTAPEGNVTVSIADYAFHVPGFYEPTSGSDPALRLQLYQTPETPLSISSQTSQLEYNPATGGFVAKAGPLETFVLFRVIDALESAPPAGLEDVRPQVERDVRLLRAFSNMESAAREFYAVAARLGVEEALNRFDDLRMERGLNRIEKPAPFARWTRRSGRAWTDALTAGESTLVPTNVSGVGQSEAFLDACFEMTGEDWTPPAMDLPETDRTRSAASQPADSPRKVRLFSDLKLRKWIIIELEEYTPVNTGSYASGLRESAMRALLSERTLVLRDAWFDPAHIERRCGYVDLYGAPTPDSREGLQAPLPQKPAGSDF